MVNFPNSNAGAPEPAEKDEPVIAAPGDTDVRENTGVFYRDKILEAARVEVLESGPTEDIARVQVELRKIEAFQELSPEQQVSIAPQLENVIGKMKYNSFVLVDQLMELFERGRKTRPNYSLFDAFKDWQVSSKDINELGCGNNCIGMAYELQAQMEAQGIKSYMVMFKTPNLINQQANVYVGSGHGALIIPTLRNGQNFLTLVDPGQLVPKPIEFPLNGDSAEVIIGNKAYSVMKNPSGSQYPFNLNVQPLTQLPDGRMVPMKVRGKVKPPMISEFDPLNEWLNPDQTIQRDIHRGLGEIKITKQDEAGRIHGFFRVDIQNSKISLKLVDQEFLTLAETGEVKNVISFEEFANMQANSDLQKAFWLVCKYISEDPVSLFERTVRIISNADAYREQIWAPSVRKGAANNN